jgi:hypothetical protein
LTTPNIRPNVYANQRRSQRILLTVPIIISGPRSNKPPFSERTTTLIVNAHGALIQLREPVLVGQTLRMKSLATGEELTCTVVDIIPGNTPIPEIGVEFSQAYPHFWRVSFPPADWSPRTPEARRATTPRRVEAPPLVRK